jgi:integrase
VAAAPLVSEEADHRCRGVKRSRDEGTIVTRGGVAVTALRLALAIRVKGWSPHVLRTTATTWMFEESNDDRDTAQDRAGMGRIL